MKQKQMSDLSPAEQEHYKRLLERRWSALGCWATYDRCAKREQGKIDQIDNAIAELLESAN